MSIASIGIVGGLGTVYYGPLCTICVLMFVLALHRSKALVGLALWKKSLSYVATIAVTGAILLTIGRGIESHKDHPLTAKQVADEVLNRMPKQSGNVTNIYNTQAAPPTENPHRPWIMLKYVGPEDVNKLLTGGIDTLRSGFKIDEQLENNGDSIAKGVMSVGDVYWGPRGAATEDQIFEKIRARLSVNPAPVLDILPGKEDIHNSVIGGHGYQKADGSVWNPAAESNGIWSGRELIYVAARVAYRDSKGHQHYTEQCLVGDNLADNMTFCDGHNTMN